MPDPGQWWAVTQDGETLAKLPTQAQAMTWLHKHQSSSVDWAIRNEGYDIVFVQDGARIWSYKDDAIGNQIAQAVAGKLGDEEAAKLFESSVQQAFTRVYGFPPDVSTIGKSIRTSFSEQERKLGWTKPDPAVVVVGTEYAWVRDMMSSSQDWKNWEKVAEILKAMGWPNAWFDSINAGVHVVYWRPDSWFVLPEHMRTKK